MTNGSSSEGGAIQPIGQVTRFDPLNPMTSADVFAALTEEQRNSLMVEYARGTLDIGKRAGQMHVDVGAFKNMLDVMASKTRELATQENTSVTMSHTQETSVGKTEVIMGNTAQAASGRLTRTMAGERSMIPFYFVGGAIVLLILVSMFTRH